MHAAEMLKDCVGPTISSWHAYYPVAHFAIDRIPSKMLAVCPVPMALVRNQSERNMFEYSEI